VSLFEPHADIIRKGREVAYGHKLNLTTGQSGLILDLVVEAGNSADSERLLPMLERHSTAAAASGRRRQLCQPRQPAPGPCLRRPRHGVPQEGRPRHRGHGQEPLALSQNSGTSAPASRSTSPASSAPTGSPAAPGAGSGTSGPYVWSAVVAYNLALFVRLKPT
jgi:transposase, IS5 family